jgi:hypothetical protein
VEAIPISRAEQLHSILQVLRQQHVFNALLRSCTTNGSNVTAGGGGGAVGKGVVEVSSTAPDRIQLNTMHAALSAMICVELNIELGGEVECSVTSSATGAAAGTRGDAACFNNLATTLAIPDAMAAYLSSVAPTSTMKRGAPAASLTDGSGGGGGKRARETSK